MRIRATHSVDGEVDIISITTTRHGDTTTNRFFYVIKEGQLKISTDESEFTIATTIQE